METTVKKLSKKVSAAEAVIQRMIKEGKPLSPLAKNWLSKDYCEAKLDMRAILR